jgi:hypothetical protein
MSLVTSAMLVALTACAADSPVTTTTGLPPAFLYPELLHAAGVQGSVRFRVRLGGVGRPDLASLEIIASPNPGFAASIRHGLREWQVPGLAGHVVERTVLFVLMDSSATDSIARCHSDTDEWLVCARRVPPHVIRDVGSVRVTRP